MGFDHHGCKVVVFGIVFEHLGFGFRFGGPGRTVRTVYFPGDDVDDFATMMVKTHLSLSADPTIKGAPKGWTLPVRDVLIYSGAKFLCPCAGTISLMPGTGSNPAFRRVDVDTETGQVSGLF